MKKKKVVNQNNLNIISINKRIYHEYYINEEIEAGLVLLGWEVKSLRARKVNISNSYILINHGTAYLLGAIITPLYTSNFYDLYDPMRTRKLLLNQYELNSLFGKVNRIGHTIVALSLYWKSSWCKIKIGIVKGKKKYDKRYEIKHREWRLNKEKIMRSTKF
ncbi:SsrA-binding protein [Candidatus Arsenophonus lipoptenae]|uniref:SsrA-binding protein n=1 Tax=Candidatus Arsenophonus lipoptenae TaxID=634113 RepID=A0A109QB93_9GAMM|nr:SsrA-binding protein SmpB [Candidatus Arsenophonus lipoptenae]AMA65051.1 SsrA-binding protein [Candidatus Arsenophonus lipoptenae]